MSDTEIQPMGTDLMYCHWCNTYYNTAEHTCSKKFNINFSSETDSQKLDRIIELLQQILNKLA